MAAGGADVSPTQTMLKKFKNSRNLSSSEKEVYKEIRRQSHISAEQKRRGSIKVWVGGTNPKYRRGHVTKVEFVLAYPQETHMVCLRNKNEDRRNSVWIMELGMHKNGSLQPP